MGFILRVFLYQEKVREPLAMVALVMFLRRRRRRSDPAPVLQGAGGTAAVLPCAVVTP